MAEKKTTRRALGRGLGNLLDSTPEAREKRASAGIVEIDLSKLRANEENPRKTFHQTSIEELAATIQKHGLLQPILVRPDGENYIVISGERRLRACRHLSLKTIPCIVKDMDREEQLTVSLIENIQREQLDSIEEALVYKTLMKDYNLTQEEVSERVGKNRATVANRVRLLNLPEAVQSAIADGRLSEGLARPLLSLKSEPLQLKLMREILSGSMNARAVEELVRRQKGQKASAKKEKKSDGNLAGQVREFEETLDTRVKIQHNAASGAGKIVIEYFNLEEFDRLKNKILSNK